MNGRPWAVPPAPAWTPPFGVVAEVVATTVRAATCTVRGLLCDSVRWLLAAGLCWAAADLRDGVDSAEVSGTGAGAGAATVGGAGAWTIGTCVWTGTGPPA